MKRILVALLSGVLINAWPSVAAADSQSDTGSIAKLVVLFGLLGSHVTMQPRVVAPERDWSIVQHGQAQREARIASEEQLREAARRVAEHERELQLARQAFRQETSRATQGSQPAASEDPLELAARRMIQREQQAYRAKLEYSRVAREVREQRQLDPGDSYTGLQ